MASWYGTDIFLKQFADRRSNAGGYFSYLSGDKAVCVFFSNDENPKIIASIAFDSTYDINNAKADGEIREMSDIEYEILAIRKRAIVEFQSDTLFKSYKGMNPNFIPISDEYGKRVYILTGPQKQGVVVFGNDYLLAFDRANNIISKKRLHKNIIPIEYGKTGDKHILSTMHTHLPETGDLITATDICTLMLYATYTQWQHHFVISPKKVSIWDCRQHKLTTMTRKAWDKMAGSKNKKN